MNPRVLRALRLFPLPLSIAICLPAMAADKPLNWGLCPAVDPLPGFDGAPDADAKAAEIRQQLPTDIEGDQLSGTNTTPQYQGNVALKRGDQFLGADNLRMDTETGNYIAEGNVRYQDTSFRMVADRAEGNQDTDAHKVTNIRYQLVDRRGNGAAESVDLQGQVGQMHRSTYTTCDPAQPIWRVRAPEIDVDNEEGFGTARNAVLQIGKVPVLYFPWFKFPIDDRRQTGLLFPQFGLSGRNGFDYLQPIYLNLAPNYDATLLPRYMSKRGLMFGTEFRYLYEGGRGEITANYLPNDKLRDKDRGSVFYSGYHNLNDHWQARSSISWVSDTRYVEDFTSRLNGMGSASSLQSTVGIYGTGETWTAGLMADRWQLTDYTLDEQALPYNRQPRAYFTWEKPLGIFEAGVYAEAVRFTHDDSYFVQPPRGGNTNEDDGDDYVRTNTRNKEYGSGARLDIKPYISMPLSGAAWFVTPTVAWRYTAYQLDSTLANTAPLTGDRSPSRSLPIASLDAGLYFDRETSVFGTNYLNTLEPRMYYLYVPYRDQNDLPVFDTRPFTFSYGQLFRDTRYTGADRQNDANQLTLAVTSRWLRQDDGREKLSLSAGQILYFNDSLVTINNSTNSAAGSEQPIAQGKSAWVADANYMINDRWSMGATYQWNPNSRKEDLASLRTRYLLNNDGIINLAYRYRRNLINGSDQLKQADFSFLYPINPTWSAVGRYYYSLLDRKPLEIIGGVQWDSCCLAVRALVRRFVRNRDGELDNSIQFEFVLKGLSSFGQNTDRTLRRAILGYYRDDLYLVRPSNTTTNPDDYDPNLIP
ncbi:LPS-assembly protein LptD [Xanthomonas fragariae]|nr:LPS-assembly protein LptD [Xanthomonas fragariae]AOD16502.1 organic solvent tolerance protein [Xanthomonas fragariae]AOD17547.1 organic solvent tolerance protein [Xanthomonas fragariae]MBL9197915.1 LPS-assembly protein LptD [Xanthomonas fragariae]MBL9220024.1 LPS-assembly protein LptD [Xanthomonas fragariae]MDM7553672.1 LPS-assembly protein LptD [Xanthomonas fragariae]